MLTSLLLVQMTSEAKCIQPALKEAVEVSLPDVCSLFSLADLRLSVHIHLDLKQITLLATTVGPLSLPPQLCALAL
jgi:hypothetical protein